MNNDEETLRILSIFHYVVGGLAIFFSFFFIPHLVIGIVALVSPESMVNENGTTPPPIFGWIFTIIGGIILLMGWFFAGSLIAAGKFLAKRKNYLFCLVMAGMSCLFIPFGTVLGVFTIVVLIRLPVKKLFDKSRKNES